MAAIKKKKPTTFFSLPAELRNEIYALSGCLKLIECSHCGRATTRDIVPIHSSSCPVRASGLQTASSHRSCTFSEVDGPIGIDPQNMNKKPQILELSPGEYAIRMSADNNSPLEQPALTRVSRQIRGETLPIFYGRHQFILYRKGRFTTQLRDLGYNWLSAMGPTNASMLRRVSIHSGSGSRKFGIEPELREVLKQMGVSEKCDLHQTYGDAGRAVSKREESGKEEYLALLKRRG